MKKILLINSLLALTLILVSCGQRPAGERAAVREKEAIAEAQGEIVAIDYANSRLAWIGYKPTGQHDGIISFSEGSLNVKNQTITGGEFVIDINSLKVVDIVDPEMNASLSLAASNASSSRRCSSLRVNWSVSSKKQEESKPEKVTTPEKSAKKEKEKREEKEEEKDLKSILAEKLAKLKKK